MSTSGAAGGGPSGLLRRLNFNCVVAAGFIALGIVLLAIIPTQIEKPLLLFGQASGGLDPKLFPSLVGAALIALGLWYLVAAFGTHETNGLRELDREGYLNVGGSLGVFLAYALLMEPLGFVIASALAIATLSLFYGARDLRLVLASAIGVPIAIYYTFTVLLKTFLPQAPWS